MDEKKMEIRVKNCVKVKIYFRVENGLEVGWMQ
jgi:hypothetical protein